MDIDYFVGLMVTSRLSNERESQELVAAFREECRRLNAAQTVEAFCDFLIATALFTRWQCDKLRVGKYKGFYLDNYLMLEQSGKGADYSSYKSRDVRTGKIVNLVVRPVAQTGGRIEYRVEPWHEP